MTDEQARPPAVSYAQHGEDIVLLRAFAGQQTGRYVDVGAFDPTVDSVTRLFYERGWRGVNIDPSAEAIARFAAERPDDVNLAVAAGAEDGTLTFFVTDVPGWSTTDPGAGAVLGRQGHVTEEVTVPVRRLSSLLDELEPGPIDFLKIDAEGAEPAVVAGLDLERHRPRVVVLEAVAPGAAPDHDRQALDRLRQAGYELAGFDGLNHYLTCEPELAASLAAPANPTDVYVKHSVAELEAALERVTATAERALWLHARNDEVEGLLHDREAELAEALRERDASHARHERSEQELAAMRASSSWRLTAPLRLLRHGAGEGRSVTSAVDDLLRRRPGLRSRLVAVVERHPRVAGALRSAVARASAGALRGGPVHDTVSERRSTAAEALAERARRRAGRP